VHSLVLATITRFLPARFPLRPIEVPLRLSQAFVMQGGSPFRITGNARDV
jgi:hypothetical protein